MQQIFCSCDKALQAMLGTGFASEEWRPVDFSIDCIDNTDTAGVEVWLLRHGIMSTQAGKPISKYSFRPLLDANLSG